MITWWSEQFLVSRPQNSFVWDETKWMVFNAKIDAPWRHTGPSRITSGTLRASTLTQLFHLSFIFIAFAPSSNVSHRVLTFFKASQEHGPRPEQTTRDSKSWETERRKMRVSQNGHVNYSYNCPFISMAPWQSSALYLSADKTKQYFPVPNWDPLCLYMIVKCIQTTHLTRKRSNSFFLQEVLTGFRHNFCDVSPSASLICYTERYVWIHFSRRENRTRKIFNNAKKWLKTFYSNKGSGKWKGNTFLALKRYGRAGQHAAVEERICGSQSLE